MPQSKEEKAAYKKEYYQNNKKEIVAKKKEYIANNKEKIAAKKKEWNANNKEKNAKVSKKYKANNKERIAKLSKEYSQTPEGKKSYRISGWKSKGIIDADFDALYDLVIATNECQICYKPFKNNKDRHLDHDHDITDDANIRYICCQYCNINIVR